MVKHEVRIELDNLRRSTSTDSLPNAASRASQRWGSIVADATSATGDPAIPASGLPTSDGGVGGSNQDIGCMPPPPPIPITDEIGPDDIAPGRDVFERLTPAAGTYVPRLRVDFYRAVWFDGLEAYRPAHYSVDDDRSVVPTATLPVEVIVSARYVVR